MKYFYALIPFVALITALPALQSDSSKDSTLVSRDVCDGNTADDRTVWCDYSIDTDWYDEVPDTGVTREVRLPWTQLAQEWSILEHRR